MNPFIPIDSNDYELNTPTDEHYVEVAKHELKGVELNHGCSMEVDPAADIWITRASGYRTISVSMHVPDDHPHLPQPGPYFRRPGKLYGPSHQEDYIEV